MAMDEHESGPGETDGAVPEKSKADLIAEIVALRERVAVLEQASAENLLPAREGLFAYFVDNVDAYVFIKDLNGRYIFINRKTEALFNIQRSVLGQRVYTDFDFFDEATAQVIMDHDHQVVVSGVGIEFEEYLRARGPVNRAADTGYRMYLALKFPLKDEAGNVIGLCGFSHDITRLKAAEAELKASEERFRQLSEAALEGILFHDGAVVLQANQAFVRMFGYELNDDLTGMAIQNFLAPESRSLILDRIQTRSEIAYEAVGLRANGTLFPVEILGRMISYQGHLAWVVVVRDVTERRLAEQRQLAFEREKERAAVLQYFISDASHDLRTPLTTIKTSLHLLTHLGDSGDPAKRARHLTIMREQTEQLERLLDHMLHMTRLDTMTAFHFAPVNVNRLIEIVFEAQQTNAARKGVALHFVPSPNVNTIQADARHLNRAVSNIVENAIQYTPEGGEIAMFTYENEGDVIVHVQDTGIGIDEADLPHIYDRFFRADPARNMASGGVGLGLSISKKIIDAHQGRIEVKSTVGQGTTFFVRLPVA